MTKNHLLDAGIVVLNNAKLLGERYSKDELQKPGLMYRTISSTHTLKTYQSAWCDVATWLFEHEQINSLQNIKPIMVEHYLIDKEKNGGFRSKGSNVKSLKSYVTVINKVLICSYIMEMSQRFSLNQFTHLNAKLNRPIYSRKSSNYWIEHNNRTYLTYKQAIDTVRAFGLRAGELAILQAQSFIQDKQTGKYFIQTIGAGNVYHLAECRADLRLQMNDYYNLFFENNIVDININVNFEGINSEKKHFWKGQTSHQFPHEIFRTEYAEQLLKQKFNEYDAGAIFWPRSLLKIHDDQVELLKHIYHANGRQTFDSVKIVSLDDVQTQVGAYQGPLRAFYEVSKSLGQNRIDRLLAYI